MRHLNLLPWREEERKVKNNIFFVEMGGAFILAVIILVFGHILIGLWTEQEQANIDYLKKETGASQTQSKEVKQLEENRKLLIARIQVIQSLEADRSSLVNLFDIIPKVIPNGIYLSGIEDKTNVIVLSGFSDNNPSISTLIKNLEGVPWITNVKLVEVASVPNSGNLSFKLQFNQNTKYMGE